MNLWSGKRIRWTISPLLGLSLVVGLHQSGMGWATATIVAEVTILASVILGIVLAGRHARTTRRTGGARLRAAVFDGAELSEVDRRAALKLANAKLVETSSAQLHVGLAFFALIAVGCIIVGFNAVSVAVATPFMVLFGIGIRAMRNRRRLELWVERQNHP